MRSQRWGCHWGAVLQRAWNSMRCSTRRCLGAVFSHGNTSRALLALCSFPSHWLHCVLVPRTATPLPQPAAAWAPACLAGPPPQPPDSVSCWEEAQAWLSQPSTWSALSVCLLRHDAMRYRVLLLEIVQTPALCPLGALSFMEQYARWVGGWGGGARALGGRRLEQAGRCTHHCVGPLTALNVAWDK